MANEWNAVTVGDIFDLVNGYAFKSADFINSGVPVIKIKNVKAGEFSEHDFSYVTEDFLRTRANKLAKFGDLLISMSGNRHDGSPETWVGKVAQFRKTGSYFINQRVGALRVKEGARVDSRFASYVLSSFPYQELFIAIATSSGGQANLSPAQILSAPMRYPSLHEQRAIAHILGALDSKIELNRRTSETLEAMARALFKGWFVDFEPVRAKQESRWHIGQSLPGLPAHLYDMFPDQLVESELGEIPVGWKLGAIEDLCSSISSGGTPARKNPLYWSNGTIPWFKTGELNDGPLLDADEKINEAALAGSSCKLWPAGTILFALYASPTVGRIGILTAPGTSNQAAAGLMAKDSFGIPFLRRVLIEAREKLQSVAVGAAQQNINQAILKSHQIILPASKLAREYSRIVSSWDDQQVEIAREIRSLNLLRDTLLHKLISGELRIPDAERIVGAAV